MILSEQERKRLFWEKAAWVPIWFILLGIFRKETVPGAVKREITLNSWQIHITGWWPPESP